MRFGSHIAGLCLVAMAVGCADGAREEPARPQVLGQEGEGTNLERFEVRQQGRHLTVQVFNRGEGARTIVVSARQYRGLDRSDAGLAYAAATEAAERIDCGGQPMVIYPDPARFQEAGRRSAFTSGEAAWLFSGRCGG